MSEAQRFPDLRALQNIFWRLLVAPEGVAAGARALRTAGAIDSEDLGLLVRSDDRMEPRERLDVYADMYFYRLRDCLAEDFAKLSGWIGPARFHNLVTDYLLVHPPAHFSLRELGRPFPGFVADHALVTAFPGIADLAALEWARIDVFDDADAVPLTRSELLEQGTAAPGVFVVALIPAVRRLTLDSAALALWREPPEGGGRGPACTGEPTWVRVWRQGFDVYHRSIEPDESGCLAVLAEEGATLARLGAVIAETTPPERAASRLAELIDVWTADAVLMAAP